MWTDGLANLEKQASVYDVHVRARYKTPTILREIIQNLTQMPAIKKRITAEYRAEQEQRGEEHVEPDAESEAVDAADVSTSASQVSVTLSSSLKRKLSGSGGTPSPLRGLDGEVLLEKRRRCLPVAEDKACKLILRTKLGNEFGVREDSIYKGQLKEKKLEKKATVKGQTLGLKMKDLVEEALKASGSPRKGVRFHWIKQYLAAKYPALMIAQRPGHLKVALERAVNYGKVELVRGIGFCGYYRLPGPAEVEEEELKDKEKKVELQKETMWKNENENEDKGDGSSAEPKEDMVDNLTKTEEENPKEKTAAQKKPKRKANKRVKRQNRINHSEPQHIEEIFPLAMTYMSEPKEASTAKIKKYLEKYYGKTDIENRLKKTLLHGLELGMWDRVSGIGASGTFQLQVDTFNPQHTESLMDMVSSAIIACSEPKIASFQLLKSYIKEYHSEFGIDTRPSLLKNAIARALKKEMIIRVSGIGMSGSFQLAQPFMPSPAILAGEEDEEEDEEEDNDENEVYVVRKTKSGRSAPLKPSNQGQSLKESSPSKHSRAGASAARGASKKTVRKQVYSESEEDSESDESGNEFQDDDEKYKNRVTTPGSTPSIKGSAEQDKDVKRTQSAKQSEGRKKGKSAIKGQKKLDTKRNLNDTREGKVTLTSMPGKAGRGSNNSSPAKSPVIRKQANRQAVAEDTEDEENYYEVEEATPLKKGKEAKPGKETPNKNKKGKRGKKSRVSSNADNTSSPRAGFSPRSTNNLVKVSY
ncbi:hypothetical protein C0Q70_01171 [Pomacea canaliculata]|uniref:H15 domain-containing protein n=1 Tax=Pomacea canaliculata TaxID=400727 RepID=A0A2T7PYQ2_POMCA|nr:hypothetical protein C0Q70_01171 [Pomacea canaliculata]